MKTLGFDQRSRPPSTRLCPFTSSQRPCMSALARAARYRSIYLLSQEPGTSTSLIGLLRATRCLLCFDAPES